MSLLSSLDLRFASITSSDLMIHDMCSFNNITVVDRKSFAELPSLVSVTLSTNAITFLGPLSFMNSTHLSSLYECDYESICVTCIRSDISQNKEMYFAADVFPPLFYFQ